MLSATASWDAMRAVDAVIICLPTPLTEHREPDLSAVLRSRREPVVAAARAASWWCWRARPTRARRARSWRRCSSGSGLRAGRDFHLAFSPERVDPGRLD